MAKVLVTESHLEGIAAAIRSKNGLQTTYKPGDMPQAILDIPTGGLTVEDEGKVVHNQALVAQTARASYITANGVYDTTYNNSVTVDVEGDYHVYSRTEHVVGEWIDGSVIYERTFEMGPFSHTQSNTITIAAGLTEADTVVGIEAFFITGGNNTVVSPYLILATEGAQAYGVAISSFTKSTGDIVIQVGSQVTNMQNGFVTIRYTKIQQNT